MKKQSLYSVLVSLVLHLLLLGFLLCHFSPASRFKVLGKVNPVPVYLATIPKAAPKKVLQQKAPTALMAKQQGMVRAALSQEAIHPHVAIEKRQPTTPPETRQMTGDALNHLVSLIYAAIDAHKVYPALGDLHGGKVLVQFTLLPTGAVEKITIVTPSGVAALDAAALETIRAATPIEGVGRYLQHPQQIAIPIMYTDKKFQQ